MNKSINIKHGYYSKFNKKKIYCKEDDCNNQITYHCFKYGNGRCRSCSKKDLLNPSYKTGKKYCTVCNKEIAYHAVLCWECEVKKRGNPKNHYNYRDGNSLSKYPKEFNRGLKEIIRKRDNYTCQYCGITEEKYRKKYKNVLSIHHIDYNKKNCNINNLITLCTSCNIKENYKDNILSSSYYYRNNKIKETNNFVSFFRYI
jgi:5-methylcytosine-specific restriction endonuclease McrA